MTAMAGCWWRAAAPWAAWRRCGWKSRTPARSNRAPITSAILDALPIPVWLRDKGLALTWGNHAFLKGAGAADLETARARPGGAGQDRARPGGRSARAQNAMQESRRFSVVSGQRRAMAFTEIPLGDAGVIGTAVDVTDVAAAEARLQQHADAHADTLDKLQTAVAIFGTRPEADLLQQGLREAVGPAGNASWTSIPSDGEILDRLRDARKLPEQRDYQAWKRARLALYPDGQREAPAKRPGTCPAARPSAWSPSRIPSAA